MDQCKASHRSDERNNRGTTQAGYTIIYSRNGTLIQESPGASSYPVRIAENGPGDAV